MLGAQSMGLMPALARKSRVTARSETPIRAAIAFTFRSVDTSSSHAVGQPRGHDLVMEGRAVLREATPERARRRDGGEQADEEKSRRSLADFYRGKTLNDADSLREPEEVCAAS